MVGSFGGRAGAGAGSGERSSVPALRLGLPIALSALVAAALVALDRGGALAGALAAPALLLGPGIALLVWRSPVEPAPEKLLAIAWLISPPLFAALLLVLGQGLAPEGALAAALLIVGLAQVTTVRRRVGMARPGKAAWAAIAAGLCLALAVAASLALAPVLLVWGDGLWWSGAAAQLQGGTSPENPWLAGTALPHRPGPAVLLAGVGRALQLGPEAALAGLAIWPLVALPLVIQLLAAPLWAEPWRNLVATGLGLVGGSAGLGLLLLPRIAWPAALETFPDLVQRLAWAPPGGAHGLPLAPLSAVYVPGATVPAWALACLALLAAVHALRHGRRPWVGLAALAVVLTLLLDPALGLAAGGAILATALLAPGSRAAIRAVVPAVGAGLVLGLSAELLHEPLGRGAELEILGPADPTLLIAALLPPLLLALLLAVPALRRVAGGAEPPEPAASSRPVAVLFCLTALLAGFLAFLDWPRGLVPGSAALLAQAALGVLAAGALVGAIQAGKAARLLALATSGVLVLGLWTSGSALMEGLGGAAALDPRRDLAELFREGPDPRVFTPGTRIDPAALAADRDEAWHLLRQAAPTIAPAPVLILGEAQAAQRLRHAPVPHPAPLRGGVPLWSDRSEPGARRHGRLQDRERTVRELYTERTATGAALLRDLARHDRSALFWVDPEDLSRSPDLSRRLQRAGCRPFLEAGVVTLFRWTPPDAVAMGRAR